MYGADARPAGTRPEFRRTAPRQELESRPDERGPRPQNTAPRPRDRRNTRRIQQFLEAKSDPTDWANTPVVDPPKRTAPKPRKQKALQESPSLDENKYKAEKNSPLTDEPLYDMGICTMSHPTEERYCQNFDLSGLGPLIQQSYDSIKTVDPRMERQLPFCAYQHHCATFVTAVLLDRRAEQGGHVLEAQPRALDAITKDGANYLVPEVVFEYAKDIGKCTTPSGDEILVNVPDIAVPQGPADGIRPGFFGVCDAETHNVYECYFSPAVTAGLIEATRDNNADWNPLPPALAPANAAPTRNLLGYGPIQHLNAEGRAQLQNVFFTNDDTIEGRLQFSPELAAKVNTYLTTIQEKFRIIKIPRETPIRNSGMNSTFVESVNQPDGVNSLPLAWAPANIYSPYPFSESVGSHSYIAALHRRRKASARGNCYVTAAGAPIQLWVGTINHNFNMVGPFAPLDFREFPEVRTGRHQSPGGNRRRIQALECWVKKVQFIPK